MYMLVGHMESELCLLQLPGCNRLDRATALPSVVRSHGRRVGLYSSVAYSTEMKVTLGLYNAEPMGLCTYGALVHPSMGGHCMGLGLELRWDIVGAACDSPCSSRVSTLKGLGAMRRGWACIEVRHWALSVRQ